MADVTKDDTGIGVNVPTSKIPGEVGYEGKVTRQVEQQSVRLPSLFFMATAGAAVAASITLFALRRPLTAIFVGLWPPTFLLLGTYNKIVKLENEFGVARRSSVMMH